MALVRMFHYSCDSFTAKPELQTYECEIEQGDEWYASLAKQRAMKDGWHLGKNWAICPTCWEHGLRSKHLRMYGN